MTLFHIRCDSNERTIITARKWCRSCWKITHKKEYKHYRCHQLCRKATHRGNWKHENFLKVISSPISWYNENWESHVQNLKEQGRAYMTSLTRKHPPVFDAIKEDTSFICILISVNKIFYSHKRKLNKNKWYTFLEFPHMKKKRR